MTTQSVTAEALVKTIVSSMELGESIEIRIEGDGNIILKFDDGIGYIPYSEDDILNLIGDLQNAINYNRSLMTELAGVHGRLQQQFPEGE